MGDQWVAMPSLLSLADVEVFVHVVERASFAHAAADLGISRSHVSRQVAALEARLGVKLLHRTTRRVGPTPTGAAFYEECAPLVAAARGAVTRVQEEATTPQGTLRVSLPHAFGVRYLVEPLVRFQALHPQVRLVVDYDDRKVDLLGDSFDLAVRGGATVEGPFVARRLWGMRLLPVASPAWVARHGTPAHPRELAGLPCLLYSGSSSPVIWRFEREGEAVEVRVDGPLSFNAPEALTTAALAGAGALLQPDFEVGEHLASGALVQLFPDWCGPNGSFWAVRPDRRRVPARVTAFVDFLAGCWTTPPWLCPPVPGPAAPPAPPAG